MELANQLFTTSSLASYAGLTVAVYVVVGFFKPWIKARYGDVAVRPFAAVVALLLQLFILYVDYSLSVEDVGLAVINSFLLAMAAAGAHEMLRDPAARTIRARKYRTRDQTMAEK